MKLTLTHKEANLVTAILWELASERAAVLGSFEPMWRLTDRDLSGAPKGTLQEAQWQ